MVRENETRQIKMRAHTVQMEDRARVTITDVMDVESFNEAEVSLSTGSGGMSVSGEGLHISRLNLDEGHLVIEGLISAIEYEQQSGGGLFSRLFR